MAKLKAQHRRFAELYLKEPNGTRAAIAAGYSEKTAGVIAHEILQRDDVKAYLAERASKAVAIVDSSVDRITRELAAIGFADLRAVFDEHGKLKPPAMWPDEIAVCIASIKTSRIVRESGIRKVKDPHEGEDCLVNETEAELVTEIKLWPKVEALKLLAQYRKMLGSDIVPPDQRQSFVGLAITVAPGAQANIQINTGKGER